MSYAEQDAEGDTGMAGGLAWERMLSGSRAGAPAVMAGACPGEAHPGLPGLF